MPFGAIYGALFFLAFGCWIVLHAGRMSWIQTPLLPFCLAVLCLVLALGLLLQRGWARWGGALLGAALAVATILFAPFSRVAEYVLLFGSLASVILLLLPATGAARRSPNDGPAAETGSRGVLGWTATLASLGLLISLGWAIPRHSASTRDAGVEAVSLIGLSERVRWTDFGSGIERARAEDKPMLVNFVTNWCPYCSKMDRSTWKHPGVIERMNDVVAVRVDAEESRKRNGYSGSSLAGRYGVNGFPTMILLDEGGQVIARTGGYLEPMQLLGWLDDAFGSAGRSAPTGNMKVSER